MKNYSVLFQCRFPKKNFGILLSAMDYSHVSSLLLNIKVTLTYMIFSYSLSDGKYLFAPLKFNLFIHIEEIFTLVTMALYLVLSSV